MNIIYIDNYDSFADTIKAYFENTGAKVTMYKSDCSLQTIQNEEFDMILLGPGPNSPKEAGNYLEIIDKYHKEKPIFGICLGFQALMEYFGEEVKPLSEVMHGSASEIEHDGKTIYQGIENKEKFARYHSLGVKTVPDCFEVSGMANDIVMSARHKTLPIEGVQFHPESILSLNNNAGQKLINNVVRELK